MRQPTLPYESYLFCWHGFLSQVCIEPKWSSPFRDAKCIYPGCELAEAKPSFLGPSSPMVALKQPTNQLCQPLSPIPFRTSCLLWFTKQCLCPLRKLLKRKRKFKFHEGYKPEPNRTSCKLAHCQISCFPSSLPPPHTGLHYRKRSSKQSLQ